MKYKLSLEKEKTDTSKRGLEMWVPRMRHFILSFILCENFTTEPCYFFHTKLSQEIDKKFPSKTKLFFKKIIFWGRSYLKTAASLDLKANATADNYVCLWKFQKLWGARWSDILANQTSIETSLPQQWVGQW